MPLPSRHAPKGIEEKYKHVPVSTGETRSPKPAEYIFRKIESRVDEAKNNPGHQFEDDDIEMIPFDDSAEVEAISSYVADSRTTGELNYDVDPMELDRPHHVQRELVVVEGNMSFLVVDTNFILSHLNIVDGLRKLAGYCGLKIVIPITVVQELDGLKNSSRKSKGMSSKSAEHSVDQLARWANDWIYSCLAKGDANVVGQKLDERINKLATKDDAILDCCLYFRQKNPKSLQVLLSNDKNLCLKALLNDVLTVSHRDGMSAETIATTVANENLLRFGEVGHEQIIQERPVASPQDFAGVDVFQTVHQEVEMLALSVVHRCMDAAYGEDLELLRDYDKKKVRTLQDACRVMSRFWMPVFSGYLRGFRKNQLQPLHGNYYRVPVDKTTLEEFLMFWCTVLQKLYEHEMDQKQNEALKVLTERWNAMAASVT